ncbi:tetraacyldisaccharide 4'-kinase [Roseibium algae]|uniref:Tetraacyldisaccharide 4'-kinase n=1 Tax=Roseibium algae TaxID=3123038 RepID=A0ABU8THD6_9HYPH
MNKAPDFWWRQGWSWQSALLALPGLLYGRTSGRRMLQKPLGKSSLPVICIGNFVLGGVGKTPFALALADRLKDEGFSPGFILRGYGGSATGPLLVDLDQHDASVVGDEALLLAQEAPTVVSADRVQGAKHAEQSEIDILIMDDGFQNPALAKDLSIALVDAVTGLGNGKCLPAGPLRAPMAAQIVMTDVLILVGEGDAADETVHLAARKGLPILHAHLKPEIQPELRDKPLLAFAGIGRPGKFFQTLEKEGLEIAQTRAFPDHHSFQVSEVEELLKVAEAEGLQLVTTSKDMARLKTAGPEIFRWLAARSEVLAVSMEIEGEEQLFSIIRDKLRSRAFDAQG